jgi:hypothetical protein
LRLRRWLHSKEEYVTCIAPQLPGLTDARGVCCHRC